MANTTYSAAQARQMTQSVLNSRKNKAMNIANQFMGAGSNIWAAIEAATSAGLYSCDVRLYYCGNEGEPTLRDVLGAIADILGMPAFGFTASVTDNDTLAISWAD